MSKSRFNFLASLASNTNESKLNCSGGAMIGSPSQSVNVNWGHSLNGCSANWCSGECVHECDVGCDDICGLWIGDVWNNK